MSTPVASSKRANPTKRTTSATKKLAGAPKSKTAVKSKIPVSKEGVARPSWKEIIRECITFNKDDARSGVSRTTIKKYAEERYHVDLSGTNIYQLNRAIATGVEASIFVLPKGPSGKVKLAPKVKALAGASKENSKPPSKSATKTASKKPAAEAAPAAAAPKKTLAGKPKAPQSSRRRAEPRKR